MPSQIQNYTGQQLVDGALARLGGLSNAVDPADMLDFINEGKNELWAYLKGVRQDYFGRSSQSATSTNDDYFPALSTAVREYDLPKECREIKAIECTTDGYEGMKFAHRDMSSPEWQDSRTASNENSGSADDYTHTIYWDIFGEQLVFASYPPAALAITLRYIRALPDIELNEPIESFLFPYFGKLKTYGAMRGTLGVRDFQGFQEWREQWRQSLLSAVSGASSRQIVEARYAEGFMEGEC
jgi:hypothetical protein